MLFCHSPQKNYLILYTTKRMAIFSLKFLPLSPTFFYQSTSLISSLYSQHPINNINNKTQSFISSIIPQEVCRYPSSFRLSYRYYSMEDEEDDAEDCSFDEAVALFNKREYYKCHDFLEALWIKAEDPTRTLVHGILQCAVGFHHLFNQNHNGAMMELGEGLCKLRKMNFGSGPFHQFEQDISAALHFIYQTQIELAACTDDLCIAMDQSERSYQLLGGYAAGQYLYTLQIDHNGITYIVFSPKKSYGSGSDPPKVKLPILNATQQHLVACSM